jgi:nicotinamidase-related amidase
VATIREGNGTAVLVVDVQVGVMRNAWDSNRIISNVATVVDRARQNNIPVIWVQHSDDELSHGSPAWAWVPELAPADGEPRIDKHFNSSFEDSGLDDELERLGITHLVLAGAATNWCIRATAYGALDRGYDLTLVQDAHTTGSIALEDGTTLTAESLIHDLNIAMTWVDYPGRTNGTAAAEAVDFLPPRSPAGK